MGTLLTDVAKILTFVATNRIMTEFANVMYYLVEGVDTAPSFCSVVKLKLTEFLGMLETFEYFAFLEEDELRDSKDSDAVILRLRFSLCYSIPRLYL